MRTIDRAFPYVVTAALLAACSDPPPPPPSCFAGCDGGVADGGRAEAGPTDVAPPDAPPSGGYEAQSYELVGRFDWQQRKLLGRERVTLNATSGGNFAQLDSAVDVKKVTAEDGRDLPFVVLPNVLHVDVSSIGSAPTFSFFVEYEASTSDALVTSASRDDDPVRGRVVYTDSEPNGGMKWLPAVHKPSDRAEFSVELTVASNEDVVANGERTKDERSGEERVVRYELVGAIPTYTMAFAAGEIEHRDRTSGRVPISVWFRRGLSFQPDPILDFLSGAMATYEDLLGAYPWPRYSAVLLPDFSGGMENTTITFTSETSAQANLNANLHAHELAHHWFGDWVTVATFDDVWIKEGMATLLAPEAQRAARDAEKNGRLFGSDFVFSPSDSIRDKTLTGIDKYTSGPYQRAAWLLAQIRDRLGDDAFWQSLRHVLKTYSLGSIDSETFLQSFGFDSATTAKLLRTIDEKRSPSVSMSVNADPDGTRIKLNVADPGGTMFAPFAMTVVDAAGAATSSVLSPDVPLELVVPTGGYLAPDEKDVHPAWLDLFATAPDDSMRLAPLLFPTSDGARTAFASRSAAHQERAVNATFYLPTFGVAPSAFATFYAGLDSIFARRSAELQACFTLSREFGSTWPDVLAPILDRPSRTTSSTTFGYCGVNFATRTFGAEMTSLAATLDAQNAGRFVYLSSFDFGPAATFDALSAVAVSAPSLELRDRALDRLGWQVNLGSYTHFTSTEERTRWQDFFLARLSDARSATRFSNVWRGVVGLRDERALVVVAEKLHTVPLRDDVQNSVVCDAYRLAQSTRPDAWKEFQQAVQPWDTLGAAARATLMSGGASCGP